jgi:hypothetical protein
MASGVSLAIPPTGRAVPGTRVPYCIIDGFLAIWAIHFNNQRNFNQTGTVQI